VTTAATSITPRVPLAIRRLPGRKNVVTPARDGGGTPLPTRAEPALVKALARAFRYQRLLDEGQCGSISEMAAAEKIEREYLGSLLRLTLLAPDLVEAIMDGRQPEVGARCRTCWSGSRRNGQRSATPSGPVDPGSIATADVADGRGVDSRA
jgi:hypothetical protein